MFNAGFKKLSLKYDSKCLLRASFLSNLAFGLLGPIYALFVKQIGGDILDAGIAYGIFSLATGLFVFFFDSSKYFLRHVRWMVVIGYLLMSIGYFFYIFIDTRMELFLNQILLALASGILDPSWSSVYSAKLTEQQSSRYWSVWTAVQSVAIGLAAFIGGLIVTLTSFATLFVLMGLLGLGSAIFASFILKPTVVSSQIKNDHDK